MLFIINPVSASGKTLADWKEASNELRRYRLDFTEQLTTRPGEAVELARKAFGQGLDCVVAVGGDGTLNEVVSGYFDEKGDVINSESAIGLLPSGTGSDFRRSIGLTSRGQAIAALVNPKIEPIDVAAVKLQSVDGKISRRYLINLASFGLGGDSVALVNSWRNKFPKIINGRVRFTLAALVALKRYRNVEVNVRLDGDRRSTVRSGFLAAANGRYAGGGMLFAPHAELNDGLLDVILTDRITRFDIIKELPRIQKGEYLSHPGVFATQARTVEIDSESPLAVDIDGEFAGYTPAFLRVLPQKIRFMR